MNARYFSLDEANALVPQVRSILSRALQLHQLLRSSLDHVAAQGFDIGWANLDDEDDDEFDFDDEFPSYDLRRARSFHQLLQDELEQLNRLGVEVTSLTDGLVDFRSWKDGTREVVLCWKLGENSISFYHDPTSANSCPQPIEDHRFDSRPQPAANDSGEIPRPKRRRTSA